MKVKNFALNYDRGKEREDGFYIHIPILPAFAIEHGYLFINSIPYALDGEGASVFDFGTIKWSGEFKIDKGDVLNLTIYYNGIRDYNFLFPKVSDQKRKEKISMIYREAEICFESGCWMAFMLLAGGLFENILQEKLKIKGTFSKLIKKYSDKLEPYQKETLDIIREERNKIHADQSEESFVDRRRAIDMKRSIDKLIVDFSEDKEIRPNESKN